MAVALGGTAVVVALGTGVATAHRGVAAEAARHEAVVDPKRRRPQAGKVAMMAVMVSVRVRGRVGLLVLVLVEVEVVVMMGGVVRRKEGGVGEKRRRERTAAGGGSVIEASGGGGVRVVVRVGRVWKGQQARVATTAVVRARGVVVVRRKGGKRQGVRLRARRLLPTPMPARAMMVMHSLGRCCWVRCGERVVWERRRGGWVV